MVLIEITDKSYRSLAGLQVCSTGTSARDVLWERGVPRWCPSLILPGWSLVHLHLVIASILKHQQHEASIQWDPYEVQERDGRKRDGRVRRRGRRIYPQPSCGASNMALVPLRKNRANKQWPPDTTPPMFFISQAAWIKLWADRNQRIPHGLT